MIGNHLQNNVQDWTQAIALLPAGTPVKAVDRGDILKTAKQVNPGVLTILRHWYDHGQHYDGSPYAVLLDRARIFFNSFVDGTFQQQYAPYVDVIETWNETLANSQTAQERQWRIDQERAFCEVWYNEFRPLYPHIKLCLANAAVGNDIPLGIAQLSQQYGYYLGYHNYIATYQPDSGDNAISFGLEDTGTGPSFREKSRYQISPDSLLTGEYLMDSVAFAPPVIGEPSPGEWAWASGRFATMDAAYKAQGVTVWKWLLTESGPVRDVNGAGWLDPQGGWRMLGDAEKYWSLLKYWLDRASVWNRDNGNRLKGSVLFTTGGGNAWEWFETKMPEMKMIAERVRAYVPPVPPSSNPLPGLRLAPPFHEAFVVSSPFDAPRDYGKHEGTDYVPKSKQGNELIHCGYDGVVDLVTTSSGYGKYVRVKHQRNGSSFWTYYCHMDTQLVAVGNTVKAGDVVGEIGSTGNSTGEHLHLTLRVPGYGLGGYVVPDVVNPDPYVDRWTEEPIPPATVKHTIYLLPQDTTSDELLALAAQLHPSRSAFTYSADVVHAVMWHGSEGSKVVIVEGHRWSGDIYAWMSARGIFYTMMDFPI